MLRTIIESPFAGDVARNLKYVRACMRDCIVFRKETPYASHALYTQEGVLDDTIPAEREMGIKAGFFWRNSAQTTAIYVDYGMSSGMKLGLQDALQKGRHFEYRAFLDGLERPSYTLEVDQLGVHVTVRAQRLAGGMVRRETLEECVEALREIAKEIRDERLK